MVNRLYLLYQFSSVGTGFLEGRIENELMTIIVRHGTVGARSDMRAADWAFFVYMKLSAVFVRTHMWKNLCHFLRTHLGH